MGQNKKVMKRIHWGRIGIALLMVAAVIFGIAFGVHQAGVKRAEQRKVREEARLALISASVQVGTARTMPTGLEWIDPEKPMVALTYDDGPGGDSTDRIQAALKKYNAHATFFMLGEKIADYPEKVEALTELGCQIASHTYDHESLDSLSKEKIKEEEQKTIDALKKASKTDGPFMVRPPYGAINDAVRETITTPLMLWSVDTLDWQSRDADAVMNRVENVEDGDIILMHEIYDSSAEATERMIPLLQEKGFQLVTIDEMFAVKGIELEKGKSYTDAYTKSETDE